MKKILVTLASLAVLTASVASQASAAPKGPGGPGGGGAPKSGGSPMASSQNSVARNQTPKVNPTSHHNNVNKNNNSIHYARGTVNGSKNYHLTNGSRFNGGILYRGRNHFHWTIQRFDARYGCTCYFDPCQSLWYYWCGVDTCYYPVSYCPHSYVETVVQVAPVCQPCLQPVVQVCQPCLCSVVVPYTTCGNFYGGGFFSGGYGSFSGGGRPVGYPGGPRTPYPINPRR